MFSEYQVESPPTLFVSLCEAELQAMTNGAVIQRYIKTAQ